MPLPVPSGPLLPVPTIDERALKTAMEKSTEDDNMSDTDLDEEMRLRSMNEDANFERKLDNLIGGLQDQTTNMDTTVPGEKKRSFGASTEEVKQEGYLNFGGVKKFLGQK